MSESLSWGNVAPCGVCGSKALRTRGVTVQCFVCGAPRSGRGAKPPDFEPDLQDEPCPNGNPGTCKGWLVAMPLATARQRRWQCNRCLAIWAYTPLSDVAQVVPSQAADAYVASILSGPTATEPE